jgi:hypothetical protein
MFGFLRDFATTLPLDVYRRMPDAKLFAITSEESQQPTTLIASLQREMTHPKADWNASQRGTARMLSESGGSSGALHGGERSAQTDTGGEQCALDLLARNIQEGSDSIGVVTFDIAKQENHALIGRELFECFLHLGTLDVPTAESESGNSFCRNSLLVEGHALAQLFHERAIHATAIRLFGLAEGADKGILRDLFGLDLVSYHVIGNGVCSVLMGFVDVALPVLERSLGHLALHDPARSPGRKIFFKIQKACPRLWDSDRRT